LPFIVWRRAANSTHAIRVMPSRIVKK